MRCARDIAAEHALCAARRAWRGVVRCRREIFRGGGAAGRPPLRRSSGDVVTAEFF
ncbi:hypothetical protein F511_46951 [Dorcoceras hygrometricum]|uniref:Uncharacterized protein n=1 Tax=Dorcoceras hygrometricum TaxID=472368 RepID=A0A2Z6ZSA8_9LAMI|nr:hypothetical protein F511_46951 [Dorcoceras hygrometricum]